MINGSSSIERPINEPVLTYRPGSPERADVVRALDTFRETRTLCSVVDGHEVSGDERTSVVAPHDHQRVLAELRFPTLAQINDAIESSLRVKQEWATRAFDERAAVFLRAAELLTGRYRAQINAATMLGQSKTVHQAEIDSAAELIDFLRFNVWYARRMLEEQPLSPRELWNRLDYRPLDGFVFAVTPFNFTAIAGNLPTAPALLGNTVVWKPAITQSLAAQLTMNVLTEAGLPPGVINLVHGRGADVGDTVLAHPDLGGVHFTGSTATFQHIWTSVGSNIGRYRQYPRLVGETGGKDFVLAHPSADVESLAVALVRGAFEFQGQKCSAASRAYIPKSVWAELRDRVVHETERLRLGNVEDFENFMGAVIDKKSFDKIDGYLQRARADSGVEFLTGGAADDETGYFVSPTILRVDDPKYVTMQEEIFGPVLSVYVYDDIAWSETLKLVDETSPYALTGAVFAQDRAAVDEAMCSLRFSAGNFYINDKPTGAVVGQQPFGGGRASGTNDKAGSPYNLLRWMSARSVKENFDPPRAVAYPYMAPE
ncbi:MAG: L-glutamate gamma-semialdehyde dehydrogenase [Myxococcota bacterium]